MTGLRCKDGVTLTGIAPEIAVAIQIVDGVYRDYGETLVITSVTDGQHSYASLHYVGHAFDCRVVTDRDVWGEIPQAIRERLTAEYDVVDETTHLHIEYQPKRKQE